MKKPANAPLPRTATATFKVINEILAKGWIDMPTGKSYQGTGAPGRLLENILGIAENNNDSPDFNDWEVKFHGGVSLLTLLHKSPEPRGIMNSLVHEHGWPSKGHLSFRHTFAGSNSDRGFYSVNEIDRVVVRNSIKDIVVPYWTHNTILVASGVKLRRLIVVDGEYNKRLRQVKYNTATAYWGFKVTEFCEAIAKGIVYIDFDARTSKGPGTALRDHGTKFRISAENIGLLYENSRKLTTR